MKPVLSFPSLKRRLLTGTAVLALAGTALVPLAAHAEPNDGASGVPGRSCHVEYSDGSIHQVPVGTRFGLLYCGQDGNWHVGWLVDAIRVAQPTSPTLPIISATAGQVGGVATAAR
jgi:hypothetical protein